MEPRAYVEAIAGELCRVRGRGLLLSAADAQLALAWHAAGVPLAEVLRVVRGGARLLPRTGPRAPRGAGSPQVSLQALAPAIEALVKDGAARAAREVSGRTSLESELLRAAQSPGLPERPRWEQLARDAEALLGRSPEVYWDAAVSALLASLRRLPRARRSQLGAVLRARAAQPRRAVTAARFRRSLQLQLLRASSELFGVPPAPFLL
jgi:hypothetical protein